ncbi:MAG: DUF3288 family protein, partial [Pseudanabaena sp.]
MVEIKDQRHPQYTKDRQVLNNLLAQNSPSNRDFADLARLTIRYKGFMGAKDIQEDLIDSKTQKRYKKEESEVEELTKKANSEELKAV